MYQVFFDGYPLHDLRDDRLILREPDVHLAVGESGSMRFIVDPDHPYADKLTRLKGVVELKAGDIRIFKGRIRKDTRDFYLFRTIEVEGLLSCLNDSIIPPFNFPEDFEEDANYQAAAQSGNVVEFFLGWLLDQHNSQVGDLQQIQLGDVTVQDPNNYISRSSSDYLPTMEVVRKKLEDLLGGYLLADYSGETTVLHYYADLPLTNVQEVEFGKNLLDLAFELDSAETYTAILPIGAEGLTIEALPDGQISPGIMKEGLIIYSTEAEMTVGGRITRKVDWQDVTEATNLRTKAANKLTSEGVRTGHTITARAVDLGVVENLPRFVVGRYVRMTSDPHDFADAWPLMELNPDILDPGDTEITMGATVKTSTGMAHASQSATQEKQDQIRLDLGAQKEQLAEQQDDLTTMSQSVQTQVTEAVQTAERIIFSALEGYVETSNLNEFKQTVESQLQVLSNEISLRFTESLERVTDVDGDLQKITETLAKHFEFSADGLLIRAGEHMMSLRLDNGLIRFMRDGQQFGWWDGVDFHTGNIVVEVNERAQFGNFAFVPRSNGSLSFLKVGG